MRDRDPAGAMHSDALSAARALALAWALAYADYDTAHDVASEVAIIAWERRKADPTFLDDPAELERFAVLAARTALRTYLRGDWRRAQREAEFEGAARERRHQWMCPDANAEYAELAGAFGAALARRPFGHRAAYIMVEEQELSYESAATHLRLTQRCVETRVTRTRRELREELAEFRVRDAA